MTTPTRDGRRQRWVLAFLAAVLAVLVALFGAAPASAATTSAAQNGVGASTSAGQVAVGASAGVVAGQRLGNDPPQPQIVVATGVAANTAARPALSISQKIGGQMGPRGWSQELMEQTVANPAATHSVWDFTTGTRHAATAYARSDGSYVVVNNSTRAVVQVSDINNAGWKPVWSDPRFQR